MPIETNFFEHNKEHFLFLFQKDDFSAIQAVVLVSQRQLLLAEGFPCPLFCQADWIFLLNLASPSRQTLLMKKEYQCPVYKQRLHPVDYFTVEINIVQISKNLIPACVHLFCTYTWK